MVRKMDWQTWHFPVTYFYACCIRKKNFEILSQIRLTLAMLIWKQNWLLLGTPLLVTEYRTTWNSPDCKAGFDKPKGFTCGPLACILLFFWEYHLCSNVYQDGLHKSLKLYHNCCSHFSRTFLFYFLRLIWRITIFRVWIFTFTKH
jgi:hypothetical protein